ncbi:hypothetical protein ACFSTC_20025 [Nonomuraea ferruginea]
MFPETPAAVAALSVARRFYSPALLNHCVRSYLWGGRCTARRTGSPSTTSSTASRPCSTTSG